MRSDAVKRGIERAPHRSLLRALGCTDREMDQPFIGVINSYNEAIPGHANLRQIADAVKAGIRMAGGTPFEGNTIGVCDGLAMNHLGMKYSLASRELIADSVEVVAQAHAFDALVLIPNCDKIIPGMLMAAARLNLPTIVVSGGPMLAGRLDGRAVDLADVFMAVGAVARGEMAEAELDRLERAACPGCGSCAGMFTANTMNCLTEALGMGLPGNGTIPAPYAGRMALAKQAGMQIMELLGRDVKALDILTPAAFRNAFAVDMALGGSTNSVLHLMAVAHEAGVDIPLQELNEYSERTPHLCRMSPAAGGHHIEDLHRAGGIPAVMRRLLDGGLLDGEVLTVTGHRGREPGSGTCARRLGHPPPGRALFRTGGLAILFGSLAPDGAVVKQAVVAPEMQQHTGPARVFDSEEAATEAIMAGQFEEGDVIVIRYEGPKGGPGHARDADAHVAAVGHGPGRQGGAADRWALFRRDAGRGHRPHLARGRRTRPAGRRARWRSDPHRHPQPPARSGCYPRKRSPAAWPSCRRGNRPSRPAICAAMPRLSPRPAPAHVLLRYEHRGGTHRNPGIATFRITRGEERMKLTGAQVVWESLVREGVDTVFGISGGAVIHLYHALPEYPIHHVLMRHEQAAAHAADGYARATGKVGVCIATSGPGATNLVTGLATAYMDSSPMVAITGQVATPIIGTDAFQEVDIVGITQPITKHNYLVTNVEELPDGDQGSIPHRPHRAAGAGAHRHCQGRAGCRIRVCLPRRSRPARLSHSPRGSLRTVQSARRR